MTSNSNTGQAGAKHEGRLAPGPPSPVRDGVMARKARQVHLLLKLVWDVRLGRLLPSNTAEQQVSVAPMGALTPQHRVARPVSNRGVWMEQIMCQARTALTSQQTTAWCQ